MKVVKGHGMYMGFAEHLSDRELAGLCRTALTVGGKRITVAEFKRLRAEAQAQGYEVFPQDDCKNVGPNGRCAGCLVDDSGNVIGPAPQESGEKGSAA